jgi:hypothetical protein
LELPFESQEAVWSRRELTPDGIASSQILAMAHSTVWTYSLIVLSSIALLIEAAIADRWAQVFCRRESDMKVECADSTAESPASEALVRPLVLAKLPVGRVTARGWLGHQLNLMSSGMVGRLNELSVYVRDDQNWTSHGGKRKSEGGNRCEKLPYWLRGAISLAALTGNDELRQRCSDRIEQVLASQQGDGYFGPVDFGGYGGGSGAYPLNALLLGILTTGPCDVCQGRCRVVASYRPEPTAGRFFPLAELSVRALSTT